LMLEKIRAGDFGGVELADIHVDGNAEHGENPELERPRGRVDG